MSAKSIVISLFIYLSIYLFNLSIYAKHALCFDAMYSKLVREIAWLKTVGLGEHFVQIL